MSESYISKFASENTPLVEKSNEFSATIAGKIVFNDYKFVDAIEAVVTFGNEQRLTTQQTCAIVLDIRNMVLQRGNW